MTLGGRVCIVLCMDGGTNREEVMTEKQEQARIDALLDMPEFSTKVLWGRVVIRGRGLNWQLGSVTGRMVGPMDAVRYLA